MTRGHFFVFFCFRVYVRFPFFQFSIGKAFVDKRIIKMLDGLSSGEYWKFFVEKLFYTLEMLLKKDINDSFLTKPEKVFHVITCKDIKKVIYLHC